MTVDLIWLGDKPAPIWEYGVVRRANPTPSGIRDIIDEYLGHSTAEAWLFWDGSLGQPSSREVRRALDVPGDVWHAGLKLGQGGSPGMIDFIHPTWMLNRDPSSKIEATSWRMTLTATLIRTRVLRQLGGPQPSFESLRGAALEMGHRYVKRGAIMRHVPRLVAGARTIQAEPLPIEDETRFIVWRYGRPWSSWALLRAWICGYATVAETLRCSKILRRTETKPDPAPMSRDAAQDTVADANPTAANVSVVIPTLERYGYLRTLLSQLRDQTVRPVEIIVIDQTPEARRDYGIAEDFPDLPLDVIYQEEPGQCTSRNAGLRKARGEYVLFVDDDDEVRPTLIEDHLININRFEADVSSGVVDEVGAGPLPSDFTLLRTSDVFPTNNTMIRKRLLRSTGLFDLAYDRGEQADGDMGMRAYLSGALMILNPGITLVHHHAPRGGLRIHSARKITYASSRTRVFHRQLPTPTEIYLTLRYFSKRQVREMLWIRACGTFSIRGPLHRKLLKVSVSLLALPGTLRQVGRSYRRAEHMMAKYPQIPSLQASSEEAGQVLNRPS